MSAKTFTKASLINELINIKARGWIEISRNTKNSGSIGNTLEDLLGIEENNLPLPNAAEWELKTQRKNISFLDKFWKDYILAFRAAVRRNLRDYQKIA